MNNDWKTITKKKKTFVEKKNDNGSLIELPCVFVLWSHNIKNNDWSLNGYNRICEIRNISDFWRLFNNLTLNDVKFNAFFLMKDKITPIWEDVANRNGGLCSFRVFAPSSIKAFEDLCMKLMCGVLNDDFSDINGISLQPKNTHTLIKIWNKNSKNDLSVTLNKDVLDKYKDVSIQYIVHKPEY